MPIDAILPLPVVILLLGLLLDTLIGDPHWMWFHPVRLYGHTIGALERCLNHGQERRTKGVLMAIGLTIGVWLIFALLELIIHPAPLVHLIVGALFFFFGISSHSLIRESLYVEQALQANDIPEARRRLSMIVGRDTSHLSAHQIRIATLETLSENLSDGVIAPLFYYWIGGIPLMMAYKMINTMDSMIGYKNDRYRDFGWFAARILDDGANYIPARLTALLMCCVSGTARAFRFVILYANHHASPNSGYPESALAGALDLRFGGPNVYHGAVVDKPYIGTNTRDATHTDVIYACVINALATLIMTIAYTVYSLL